MSKARSRVDPVEVFCRVRPIANADTETSCLKILDENNMMLQIPENSASYRSGQIKQLIYSFTHIFDECASQKDIFDQVGLPLVQDLLVGKNGLLFTYGVTGSGKTYSMIGNPQDMGLLQRCLDTVFNSILFQQAKKYIFKPDKMNSFEIRSECEAQQERLQRKDLLPSSGNITNQQQHRSKLQAEAADQAKSKLVQIDDEHMFAVFISCIEIYNNYIYDLLDEFGASSTDSAKRMDNSKESKSLKEDAKGFMYIKDVSEIEVKSTEEALELMNRAQKRRVVACTDLNAESSRSHSIFTIRVVQCAYDPSGNDTSQLKNKSIQVSQLSLVDLAGSERTKRTKNTGSRLREAGSINSSLMALRNCMEALRENVFSGCRKIVPYRDSKLTLLFKNYFEGNGKIKMILCINPSAIEFDETIIDATKGSTGQGAGTGAGTQANFERISIDTLEQENLLLLSSLQQKNYTLMPESFPPLDIFTADDDITINRLIHYLEEFQRKRDAILHETDLLKQKFYMKLREMHEDYEKVKEERNELRTRLELKDKEQSKMESKMKALEKVINTNSYRTPIQNAAPVAAAATAPATVGKDKSSKPAAFQTPNTGNNVNLASSATYSLVRNATNQHNNATNDSPFAATLRNRLANNNSNGNANGRQNGQNVALYFANNANNASSAIPVAPNTPSTGQRQTLANNSQAMMGSRFQSPIRFVCQARDGLAVANRRVQRRSKSAEMWLDHKPTTVAKLDTVMQPKMQKKKSVSKIELTDTKKSTKYVLTTQQTNENGEFLTNLIKGDILQSPSGGANVIFTDIETLKVRNQDLDRSSSVNARKRSTDEFVSENRETIENRDSGTAGIDQMIDRILELFR